MTGGPFRVDPEIERRVPCGSLAEFRRAWRAQARWPWMSVPVFATCVAANTLLQAIAARSLAGLVSASLFGMVAAWLWRDERRRNTALERGSAMMPTHCAFSRAHIHLEGRFGATYWSYAAVRGVRAMGAHVLIEVPNGFIVLATGERDAAEWVRWIRTRTPQAGERIDARGEALRRDTLLLTMGHVLAVTAAILAQRFG